MLRLLLVWGCYGIGGFSIPAAKSNQDMTAATKTIWHLVDDLVQNLPFTRGHVENIFGQTLVEVSQPSNDKFHFLTGGPYHLVDGSEVTVDLRIKRGGGHPGFLVLGLLSGACVSRSDVMRRHSDLGVTGGPRGRSDDDATVFSAQRPWGVLSFSFLERQPDCLASVAFDPAK